VLRILPSDDHLSHRCAIHLSESGKAAVSWRDLRISDTQDSLARDISDASIRIVNHAETDLEIQWPPILIRLMAAALNYAKGPGPFQRPCTRWSFPAFFIISHR